MIDIVVILVLLMILGAASFYVYRSKKAGVKCVGCPTGCSIASAKVKVSCGCGCGK
ncbi:MAG: hypothetical protein IKL88_00095 [Erysipelotrichales bacterium]|nr:hypothetical protein [Erysipelotrichales bacterium]